VRIAVVQHSLRPAPAQDLEALVLAVARSAAAGVETVILPDLSSVFDGPLGEELWCRIGDETPGIDVLVPEEGPAGTVDVAVEDRPRLGRVAFLSGDACIDAEVLAAVASSKPDLAVLAPRSESELQAQAVLEVAIGLSTSLAAVVVIVEPDGAALGDPGHGGSAVLHLGEVVAEAMAGDDVLTLDLDLPAGPPEPRGALPLVPPVLLQRLAAHRGQKLDVGYPADLD
jgi:hypothetical protein